MKLRIAVFALLSASSVSHAAPVALSPGVLVDLDTNLAFAVTPDGLTQQVRLRDGSLVWTSSEKAYPLALADQMLVALAAPDAAGSANVLFLDPTQGKVIDRVSVDLPESVSADFFAKPNSRFEARVLDTEEGIRFVWLYQSQPLRGAAIVEIDANGNEVINPMTVETGAFDLVSTENRRFAIPVQQDEPEPAAIPLALRADERLPGVSGEQYRAGDNRHALTSTARAHEVFGQIYQWTIYERSGNRVGDYESPYALAPYVVSAQTLIFRDQPVALRGSNGRLLERGTRLVAVDLSNKRELWSIPVLDAQYRGPLPP